MKKSKRLLSILLACLMIVSMFPVAAFADDDANTTITDATSLKTAVENATAGATITIPAGTYDVGSWNINNPVSLTGSGKVTLKGQIIYKDGPDNKISNATNITISVKNINFEATDSVNNQGLCFSTGVTKYTLIVEECAFDGYKYGITANSGATSNTLSVSDLTFENTGCAFSFAGGNTLNTDGSLDLGGALAAQYFISGGGAVNYYYEDINSFLEDQSNNFENAAPDISVSTSDRLVTTQTELNNALTNASNNATILIGADIALDENGLDGTMISGKTLTIIGNGRTLSFTNDLSKPKTNGVFGNNNNPLYADTNLTVKNLVIKNTGTQGGYASIVGYNATGASITYEDCTFDNLYASVYVNPIEDENDNVTKDGVSLSISGCTFENTQYGYAVDTTSGLPSKIDVTFDNNTGDIAENEPVTGVVYATVNKNGTVGAFDTIQGALDAVVNNGTVTITPGTYEGDITISRNIENLTITGEDGAVIKDGSLKVATNGIQLPGLTIENLAFENANIQMSPNGDSDLSGLTICNNTFTGTMPNNHSAIHLNLGSKAADGSGADYDGLTITGNTIKDITSGNNSGILIRGDGTTASDVTITNNTIDGVGWNGIQLNNMLGKAITVTGNDIRNCGATDPDGVINLYHSKANSFKINENKIIVGEGQLGVSNISDDVNLNRNYWGTPNPDFDKLLGYTEDTAAVEVDEFYRAESMQPEDLNTYEPPYTGKFSHEIFTKVGDNGTIDVDRYATEGDKVTITVSPDEAYMLDEMTITSGGKDVEVTDNGDGTYTFTMPSGDVKIEVTFAEDPNWEEEPAMPFVDVNEGDWFYDVVLYAYENGLMTGTSADTFAPNQTTTRGMIVSMLARLEGVTSAESAGFTDVADNDWYATAVNWAASEGIVNGFEDDTFRPNAPITREQMAAILYNYADYKGYDVSARADLSDYADAASISSWAEDVLSWANAEGLINGMTATTIDPQGATTRAQTAAMFERFLTAHAE